MRLSLYSSSTHMEGITYEGGVNGQIPGDVRVIVDESADQLEVVASLLRIASLIEQEEKARREPGPGREDGCPF